MGEIGKAADVPKWGSQSNAAGFQKLARLWRISVRVSLSL